MKRAAFLMLLLAAGACAQTPWRLALPGWRYEFPSDHAPHHVNVKMLEFDRAAFGITGLETAVGLALTKLPLSITRLIELFSINPQKIMKVVPWGLFEGSDADLTILDLNRTWTFDVNQSRSRSRNSPFYGWPMKGKAVGTIVGGKVVFQDRA